MNRSHRSLAAAAALLLTVLSVACSERDATQPEPGGGGAVTEVLISNFAFSAPTVTINRGETVRWRNTTGSFHTVTPNGHQAFAERQTNASGQTFQTKFDTPGRYEYFCEPHRSLGMTGVIEVQ